MVRIGQCSRFTVSPETGLPSEPLRSVLKANNLPTLSAKQDRLLSVARDLTLLVKFNVEEIERTVHATLRFIYYMHLVESCRGEDGYAECEFQFRRWWVRSAYREEDIGLTLEVPKDASMALNCDKIRTHAESLDDSGKLLKFCIFYDIARVYLAQGEYQQALEMFQQCQAIDPQKCKPEKFGLSGRSARPSVDEYVEACTEIISNTDTDADMTEGDTQTYSDKVASLVDAGDYQSALTECLLHILENDALGDNFSWLLDIQPKLIIFCAKQTISAIESIRSTLIDAAGAWLEHRQLADADRDRLLGRAQVITSFLTGHSAIPAPVVAAGMQIDADSWRSKQGTIPESQIQAHDFVSANVTTMQLAMLRLSYGYLVGLRLLEKEQYKEAQVWFSRAHTEIAEFEPATPQATNPIMAAALEKEEALKASLIAQVSVHAKLAALFYQLEQGTDIDDVADDIDSILEDQAPIRFEFMESLSLICLRQGNNSVFTSLVGAIAANPKLYQQLPEIHIALLQIASDLVLVRNLLLASGVEIDRAISEPGYTFDKAAIPKEQLEQVRKSVSEIAKLLMKIPVGSRSTDSTTLHTDLGSIPQVGAGAENEIERFCRMWGDPVYLTLFAALLSEMLQGGEPVSGPLGLCSLMALITRQDSSDTGTGKLVVSDFVNSKNDQGRKNARHLRDIAMIVFRYTVRLVPRSAAVWLFFSAVASSAQGSKSKLDEHLMPLYTEFLSLHTDVFSPELLDNCVSCEWFQKQLPGMIRSLSELGMRGAAAALHQYSTDINYELAMPLLVQAFEKKEIDQQLTRFFWDSNMIEYGQYLGRLPSSAVHVEFSAPDCELASSRPFFLSELFGWLSSALSLK
ncbi:hypothetical protein FBU59_001127 [Linderina macrospora]|uniref:Uncharacterized protein n=1 Tax=Linderina macrospora TaxID=4868 RepID=A0ACC1JF03_9FUNG|nr:hypothetical protein FBU59_001127 [Linderina macrospora]